MNERSAARLSCEVHFCKRYRLPETLTDATAFHITSDEVLTWNQIYQHIAEALGVEAKVVHIPSDLLARVAPELAGSLLGDKT